MQEISKLQGVFQKNPFLFRFPFLSPPARRRRRPVCFPGRRRHVPADPLAWIRSPTPCSSLSLSPYPLAFPSLSLQSPERPKQPRRRDSSRPALCSFARHYETTTGTAVPFCLFSSQASTSNAAVREIALVPFLSGRRSSPSIPPPPLLLRPRRPHHRVPRLTVSSPVPSVHLLPLWFVTSPETRGRRRTNCSPELFPVTIWSRRTAPCTPLVPIFPASPTTAAKTPWFAAGVRARAAPAGDDVASAWRPRGADVSPAWQ